MPGVAAGVGVEVSDGVAEGVVVVSGVAAGDGVTLGDGVGVGVGVGVFTWGTTGAGVGVRVDVDVGDGVLITAAVGRGVTGATVVPDGDTAGAKALAPSANLVPNFVAPPGTFVAPGARLSVTIEVAVSGCVSPERKMLPMLAAQK